MGGSVSAGLKPRLFMGNTSMLKKNQTRKVGEHRVDETQLSKLKLFFDFCSFTIIPLVEHKMVENTL